MKFLFQYPTSVLNALIVVPSAFGYHWNSISAFNKDDSMREGNFVSVACIEVKGWIVWYYCMRE